MGVPGSSAPLLFAPSEQQGGYTIERSLRFNSSDSAFLSRTPSSAGNRKTWTWAGWVKRSAAWGTLFRADPGSNDFTYLTSDSDKLVINQFTGASAVWGADTVAVFRDYSAWYHIVLAVDTTQATASDRLKLYINNTLQSLTTRGGYPSAYPAQNNDTHVNRTIDHRIGNTSNAYLADIHFIDGQALTPSSFGQFDANNVWQPKAYSGSYGTNGFHLDFADNSAATATTLGKDTSGNGNNWTPNNLSVTDTPKYSSYFSGSTTTSAGSFSGLFDSSLSTFWRPDIYNQSWNVNVWTKPTAFTGVTKLRMYLIWDQGNQVPSTEPLIRIDGNDVTRSNSPTMPAVNTAGWVDLTGRLNGSTFQSFQVRAQSNSTSSPAIYAIEINDAIVVENQTTDSLVDSPTNYGTDTGTGGEVRGNYATFNPVDKGSSLTLANGNLDVTTSSTNQMVRGTLGVKTGKWYYEAVVGSTGNNIGVGILNEDAQPIGYSGTGNYIYTYATSGNKISVAGAVSYGASLASGDVVGIALDADGGTLAFYKNGASQGNAYTGLDTTKTWFPGWFSNVSAATAWSFNFGQRPFAYTAPSGFKALCTTNLPEPTIAKPNTVFDVLLWTGTSTSSARTVSGLNFSPELVWSKARSQPFNHQLWDVVRGTGKELVSNSTGAENTNNQYGYLSAFNSDGFTATPGSTDNGFFNETNTTYAAWCWDAGSSTVTNTEGSITSQVRANASAGFSIVTYTGNGVQGATVGHGLGVAPSMVLYKSRDGSLDWLVYHSALGATQGIYLNQTLAAITSSNFFNNTAPNSTTLYLNSAPPAGQTNTNGNRHLAYCFAPVAGYSAMSSFVGNGSADGVFVYTGFRPRFVMIKRTNNVSNWFVHDSARSSYNAARELLFPNLSNAEDSSNNYIDLLSNGFKLRFTNTDYNTSNNTYIYFAFAESPFAYARAR